MHVILNEKHILSTSLSHMSQDILIKVPDGVFKLGENRLRLDLPDAKVPDNGDTRTLGFALQDIKIL
jgi:hypothetical protein